MTWKTFLEQAKAAGLDDRAIVERIDYDRRSIDRRVLIVTETKEWHLDGDPDAKRPRFRKGP